MTRRYYCDHCETPHTEGKGSCPLEKEEVMKTPVRSSRIAEIKNRLGKCTAGKWEHVYSPTKPTFPYLARTSVAQFIASNVHPTEQHPVYDAAFIANSRQDIVYLLEELAQATALLDKLVSIVRDAGGVKEDNDGTMNLSGEDDWVDLAELTVEAHNFLEN